MQRHFIHEMIRRDITYLLCSLSCTNTGLYILYSVLALLLVNYVATVTSVISFRLITKYYLITLTRETIIIMFLKVMVIIICTSVCPWYNYCTHIFLRQIAVARILSCYCFYNFQGP